MMAAIELINLHKQYGETRAVDGLSLEVDFGEIVGLIGPDGAGKTSTLRMVVSLLRPNAGDILFMGKDALREVAWVRAHVGYMPQRFSLYQDLTVEQNMRFFGDLFNMPPAAQKIQMEKLYAFSRLGPFKQRLAGQLSGGMKQKLALSCMLMHQPRVIVLDEPTFGVDPVSRHEFWEILHELRGQDVAVLVSTAYMDEAMQCDRVGLMYESRLLALDTPQGLLNGFPGYIMRLEAEKPEKVYTWLRTRLPRGRVQLFGDGIHIAIRNGEERKKAEDVIKEIPHKTSPAKKTEPQLEDLFLHLLEEQHV